MKTAYDDYITWFRDQTMQGVEPTPESAWLAAFELAVSLCGDVLEEANGKMEEQLFANVMTGVDYDPLDDE